MLTRVSRVLMFMFLGASASLAWGQGVNPDTSPTNTNHTLLPYAGIPEPPVTWRTVIGTSAEPIGVELSPTGPAWQSLFHTNTDAPIPAGSYVAIREHLTVGGTTPWSGWHVELSDPGFALVRSGWTAPLIAFANGTFVPANITLASASGLDATFPSLAPGTAVDFDVYIWRTSSNPLASSFSMSQYPTPEPATLALITLAGVVFVRRRPRTTN